MPAGRAKPRGLTVPSLSQILLRLIVALAARQIPIHSYIQVSISTFPPHTRLSQPFPIRQQLCHPTCIPQAGAESVAKGETQGAPR